MERERSASLQKGIKEINIGICELNTKKDKIPKDNQCNEQIQNRISNTYYIYIRRYMKLGFNLGKKKNANI